jgi:hypothetical protein
MYPILTDIHRSTTRRFLCPLPCTGADIGELTEQGCYYEHRTVDLISIVTLLSRCVLCHVQKPNQGVRFLTIDLQTRCLASPTSSSFPPIVFYC